MKFNSSERFSMMLHDMDIGRISSGCLPRQHSAKRPTSTQPDQPSANGAAEARIARSPEARGRLSDRGTTVYGGDNKKIGSIATVLMRPKSPAR
jgi:hypothetical protein